MIRLTSGRAHLGRRRGAVLAAVICLVAAFGALNVSSAAALGEQCSGANAKGLGAFLQTRAQQRWTGKESGFNGSSNPFACNGSQGTGGKPQVGYVPVSSTAALRAWGANDGILHSKEFNFLGTDIAPAGPVSEPGTMLANMKAALGSDVVVVPVTQTAIAIAAHPPQLPAHAACTVPKITPTQLQKVFSGEIKNWRQVGTASDSSVGGDCDQAITRIVRDESAGTTYQFKHFLNQVNSAPLACTGKEKRTWTQLQAPFGPTAETSPNQEWPSNSQCQTGEGKVTTVSGPGGEGEIGPLKYVAENPGTITYGSLPEAQMWAPKQVISVFNGIKYSDPESGEGEANCAAAKYTRPAGWEAGVNIDWSQVYGSDPNIGEASKNAYPICTLSWDVAAANHFTAKVATTVHDYLAFVVDKEGGQAAARHVGYRELPASIAKASTAAIAHINGEEAEEEEGGEEEEGTGTVLCKAKPFLSEGVLACPKGEGFTGIKVSGSLTGTATFKGAAGESELVVLCPEGKYHGEFNEDGTSAGGGITEMAFGLGKGCTTNLPEEPEAFVSLENTPLDASSFQYLGAEAPQGAFTLAKSKGEPVLRIQSSITCIYLPLKVSGQVTNGSPTQLNLGGEWKLVEETGEGCPSVLAFAAQFSVTQTAESAPLYIAGKVGGEEEGGEEEEGGGGTGTVLCNTEPEAVEGVLTCAEPFKGEKVTGTLLPEKAAVFESTSGPKLAVTCTEGRYGGLFNAEGQSTTGIYEFIFGLGAGCSTTFPEGPEAIVSFENGPFDASAFKYTGAEGPNGTLSLAKSGGGVPLLRIQSSTTCVYATSELGLTVFNGSPSQLFMKGSWKLVEAESEACPSALNGFAPMTMTAYAEHLPLYIAGK
jgi:ABC-type phosphate transport system substrate-binding protein